MTDHITEAERFHNEYRRIRTPGQLPTTADVLALANYHATMAVHDAVRGLVPKPVETDDARPTRCGRVRINQLNGPYHPCQMDKGHDGEHQYLVQILQDAAGSPQSDEQPEPGQVDGGKAAEASRGSAACLTCGHSRMGGITLSATSHNALVSRAEKAEAERDDALAMAAQSELNRVEEKDKADRAEAERDAILNELRKLASYASPASITALVYRHTPKG